MLKLVLDNSKQISRDLLFYVLKKSVLKHQLILPAYREQILDFKPESLRESLSIGKYYWILGWNPLSNPYNQGAFYCILQDNPVFCLCE